MENESNSNLKIPEAVTLILEEFQDLFPNELPQGLPPLRDIQPQVDCVPSFTLPNQLHYRISSTEHEELRHQVEELLERDLFVKVSIHVQSLPR